MTFYSKITKELKKQFKTSDIPIPNIRAKCVTIAQRIQEGLYRSNKRRGFIDVTTRHSLITGLKYPYISSKQDYKD